MSDEAVNLEDMDWDNIEVTAPSVTEEQGEPENVQVSEEEGTEENQGAKEETPSESEESAGQAESEDNEQVEGSSIIDISSLADDAKIKVKVDGEEQEITLKEYKNGISGEKAIAKRFSEFDRKEKEFKQQIDEVNQYIAELGNTLKNKSVVEGLYQIGELNNIPPHVIKEALIKEIAPELDRRLGLTDEELHLEVQKEELEYNKKRLESESKQQKAKQAQEELQNSITKIRETHAISESEWNEAFSSLDSKLPENEQITVEMVAQKVQFDRAGAKSQELLNSFEGGALRENAAISEALQEIILDSPDLTEAELNDLLAQAYASEQQKQASEQVKEAVQKKQKPKNEQPQEKFQPLTDSNGDEILDWDDL